jgi:hypothetical protein
MHATGGMQYGGVICYGDYGDQVTYKPNGQSTVLGIHDFDETNWDKLNTEFDFKYRIRTSGYTHDNSRTYSGHLIPPRPTRICGSNAIEHLLMHDASQFETDVNYLKLATKNPHSTDVADQLAIVRGFIPQGVTTARERAHFFFDTKAINSFNSPTFDILLSKLPDDIRVLSFGSGQFPLLSEGQSLAALLPEKKIHFTGYDHKLRETEIDERNRIIHAVNTQNIVDFSTYVANAINPTEGENGPYDMITFFRPNTAMEDSLNRRMVRNVLGRVRPGTLVYTQTMIPGEQKDLLNDYAEQGVVPIWLDGGNSTCSIGLKVFPRP